MTNDPAVITKIYVLLIAFTIAFSTSSFTVSLKPFTNELPAPAIAAWISATGTPGRIFSIPVWDLFRKTEFAMASAMVTPETWAQVMKPTAWATLSGSTIACATEKEACANIPVPRPMSTL